MTTAMKDGKFVRFQKNSAGTVPAEPTGLTAALAEFRKAMVESDQAIKAAASPEVIQKLVAAEVQKMDAARAKPKADFSIGEEVIDLGDPGLAREELIFKAAAPDQRALREFQDWQDGVYLLKTLFRKSGRGDVRKTRAYQGGARKYSRFIKALDTSTANQGTDWLPTEFSGQLRELVRTARRIPGLFDEIPMPTKSFTLPVENSDLSAVILAESTSDDATDLSASQPGTTAVTLTATKIGRRVMVSDEVDEDSIIAILPWLRKQTALAIATGIEDAILNGDITASHQDNDVTSSVDVRKAWRGLRKQALANSDSVDASNADVTDALLSSALLNLEQYGEDPENIGLLTGLRGYTKLRTISQVRTVDLFGPQATIQTGRMPRWAGTEIVVSQKMREDLNASGVRDSTTQNRNTYLLVHKPSWVLGVRRAIRVRTWEKVSTEQLLMVVSWRGDFKCLYGNSASTAAILYNGKTT